ncbi:MAG TPA: GNAT family N-acetyltransferase [Rhodothermales bacterium]
MQLTEQTRELVIPNVTRRFGRPFRIDEVDLSDLETLHRLNLAIFEEQRIINTFDREDLLVLLAYVGDVPVGFKVGYRENRFTFYSAKGGVLDEYRRCGIARALLFEMMERARERGYRRFAFDTFPNRHAGMAIMGFVHGFRLVKADYNPMYKDYRLRLEKKL